MTKLWRHKKRGSLYQEIGRGFCQVSSQPIEEGSPVVIYKGIDGQFWVRHVKEFEDGRFEEVVGD